MSFLSQVACLPKIKVQQFYVYVLKYSFLHYISLHLGKMNLIV